MRCCVYVERNACRANLAERAEAWGRIVAQAPGYAGYETKTDREIPVVRLRAA